MERYILNFDKITESYPDTSDYHLLYTHIQTYMLKNNIQKQTNPIFLKALQKFKNPTLISITYKLLQSHSIDLPILKHHVQDINLRNDIFHYLSKNYAKEFEPEIIEHLYDPFYFSDGLISIFKNHLKPEIYAFFQVQNIDLIPKQVDFMIELGIFVNLEYFVGFVGCKRNEICYKIYELLFFIVQRSRKHDFTIIDDAKNIDFRNDFNDVGDKNKDCKNIDEKKNYVGDSFEKNEKCIEIVNNSIKFKKTIKVENITNFLIYFYDFFEEKETVREFYQNKDETGLIEILKKYVIFDNRVDFENKKMLSVFENKPSKILKEDLCLEDDPNFDYLFGGYYFKVYSDCIEI